ncbi:MAG: hypothetical protein ACREP6_15150 [Candidatus Binataceae bacterium]
MKQLRARLARENQRWRAELARTAAAAKKARLEANRRADLLREQSRKMAAVLKKSLASAKINERRRREALAKAGDLRAALRQTQQELRAASQEIRRLTREASTPTEIVSELRSVPMEEPIVSEGVRPVDELATRAGEPPPAPPGRNPPSED